MRIMKWKDAVQEYGTFLYTEKEHPDSPYWSDAVYVNYPTSSGKLCTEPFPSTTPEEHDGREDFDNYQDNLELYEIGKSYVLVSYMQTSGDILEDEQQEDLIVVYDNADIDVWINKLKALKR